MWKYIKTALANRWNLLALFAGVGFGLLSSPGVVLPLVAAAELGYLAMLGSHPRFQAYVDRIDSQALTAVRSKKNKTVLRRILRSLPRELLERYNQLKQRCADLQCIAADLRQPGLEPANETLESLQSRSLDRLLWIYLRLLFTFQALDHFLKKTSLERIESDVARLKHRLGALAENDSSPRTQKMRRALTDNLATSQGRIDNYRRAAENLEFVELELDRLENKIKSLAEVAVNRQEPDYISDQVDEVAGSMLETEKTMNDLKLFTGLGPVDEGVPALLTTSSRSR